MDNSILGKVLDSPSWYPMTLAREIFSKAAYHTDEATGNCSLHATYYLNNSVSSLTDRERMLNVYRSSFSELLPLMWDKVTDKSDKLDLPSDMASAMINYAVKHTRLILEGNSPCSAYLPTEEEMKSRKAHEVNALCRINFMIVRSPEGFDMSSGPSLLLLNPTTKVFEYKSITWD